MAEKKPSDIRAVDFVAEELEAEADRMPPSYEAQANLLREAAKLYRESKNPKRVRLLQQPSTRSHDSIRDASDVRRRRRLGDVGEELAESLLKTCGFTHIENLNRQRKNFPYADFYAERSGERYVISVKTRNKYESNGKLNGGYKLGSKCREDAAIAEKQFRATAAWLTIAVDEKSCSAYFGLLSSLKSQGVPMSNKAISRHECLAKDMPHPRNLDYGALKNVYRRRD